MVHLPPQQSQCALKILFVQPSQKEALNNFEKSLKSGQV